MRKPALALLSFLLVGSGSNPEPLVDPVADPVPMVAHTVPPSSESQWGFGDGGSYYLVGKTTGSVTILRASNIPPEPDRKPRPAPRPVAEFKPVAAFLFFDPRNFTVDQAAIKTDPDLRAAASRAGVPLYSVFSDESEFAGPTWQSAIGQTGTPCLVLLDKANRPKTVKIQTAADVLEALK